jgi:translation initiation factor 3 subunit A
VYANVLLEREKEKVELERKLARMAKQLDHLERARREEEVAYLTAAYNQRHEEDREVHEAQQKTLVGGGAGVG